MSPTAAPRTVGRSRPVRGAAASPLSWLLQRVGPAWPLKLLLLGFPLWWALGLASVVWLVAAVAMAVQMVRRGRLRVPAGFGVWVLFLGWMLAGVFVLWTHAPGTVADGGPERLVGFGVRVLWYLAVTVAMLYPLSLPSRALPAVHVVQWLAWLFVAAVAGGLAALAFPSFGFTSPVEWLLPGARSEGFVRSLVHPALSTQSEFLGFEQPRPRAPFAYANAWGNNVGVLVPFFVYAAVRSTRRWWRWAAPLVLALAALPMAYSLNRGLWAGLCLLAGYLLVVLVRSRRFRAAMALVVVGVIAALALMASPVGDTVELRLQTPHSNERRTTVAQTVTQTTLQGSPLLGYGTTRQVQGNFDSISGGQTPDCRQCAAPPLGTQGFLWRLVFTTGFVGTGLFAVFLGYQFLLHVRRTSPMAVLGCMCIAVSAVFFLVYDSLESPLFLLMLAVGLMNRERLEAEALPGGALAPAGPAGGSA